MRIITLAIALLICTAAEAQVIRAEPFYTAPDEAVSGNLLLDDYPGAAVAYSLRKLDKDYTGSAIRVRRSSDNTEQDIGFVNNYLDTAAMKTFVGISATDSAWIVTWYNQADSSGVFGTRNLTQSSATLQPRIITSGVINRENSDVALRFDGAGDRLRTYALPSISFPVTVFSVFSYFSGISTYQYVWDHGNDDFILDDNSQGTEVSMSIYNGSRVNGLIASFNTQYSVYALYNSTSSALKINTNSYTGSTGTRTGEVLTLGTNGSNSSLTFYGGNVNEFISYWNNQSTNETAIRDNINSFYSIY